MLIVFNNIYIYILLCSIKYNRNVNNKYQVLFRSNRQYEIIGISILIHPNYTQLRNILVKCTLDENIQ